MNTSPLRRDEGEHRALWIETLHHPLPARHFLRAMSDPAALCLDPVHRRVDRIDVEIIEPERHWRLGRAGHDAALLAVAGVEQVVDADRPHIEFAVLVPAEEVEIEAE